MVKDFYKWWSFGVSLWLKTWVSLSKSCGLFLWKFGLIFWKCVLCILDDFGKCGCEWSDNYGFMQVKCEHVLLHTKCLINCLYEIFGFDSLFLICFKFGGLMWVNSQIIWANLTTIAIFKSCHDRFESAVMHDF